MEFEKRKNLSMSPIANLKLATPKNRKSSLISK